MVKTDNKMKNKYIIICITFSLLVIACSKHDTENNIDDLSGKKAEIVNLSGGMNGLTVLIFDKKTDNSFNYNKSIATGWSDDGKLSTNLALGMYKFLFFKSTGANTILEPSNLSSAKFENIKLSNKSDENSNNNGETMYVLPSDEIWLPKSVTHSNQEYPIYDPTTVYDTLTRAVAKIEFRIKRGIVSGQPGDSLVFDKNQNIMQNIKSVSIDISGIAKSATLWGGETDAKTKVTYNTADSITDWGFAMFDGLYVIPKGTGSQATINFTLTPADNNAFPVLTKEIKGDIKRNQKLIITLWLTSTYKFIDVEVDVKDIENSIGGDSGMWE